jgi:ABC-2 type transport system permease protein
VADPDPDPDPDPEPEPEAEAGAGAGADVEAEPEPGTRAGAGAEHGADVEAGAGAGTLAETLPVYGRLVRARVRAAWQYRTSFFLFLLGQTLAAGLDFAIIAALFSNIDALAGWSVRQVAFLYGLSGLAFGLSDIFVSPVDRAGKHIKSGSFDIFLTRPMGTIWQLAATEFELRRVGRTIQPAIVLAVVLLGGSGIHWTPAAVALVPLSLLSGAAIYGALWVITTAPTFWVVEIEEVANAFTYGGQHLAQYPIDVLGRYLRGFVTFAVPLAFVAYLPAAWLFGKPMPFGLPRAVVWSAPLVAAVLVVVAQACWRLAVRHYRSTGS